METRLQATQEKTVADLKSDAVIENRLNTLIVAGLVLTGTSVIMGVFSHINFYVGHADLKTHYSHKT